MAGILNKLMDFIGIEDVDDEGYNEDYFNDEQHRYWRRIFIFREVTGTDL